VLPAALHNFRDLGGMTAGDRVTGSGRVYRSGSPDELTATEWSAITDLGITTLVDLRNPDEIHFARWRPHGIASLNHPVEDQSDADFMAVWGERLGSPIYYAEVLGRWPELLAGAFSAIADAPPGGLLLHCAAGRDRTGMIVALLLTLVGVDRGAILDDYERAVRAYNVRLQRGDLRERARSDAELDAEVANSRRELSEFLDSVDVESYLLGAGVTPSQLAAIQSRLLE
jgi:protein-tyrosine phosphatase